jgi:hypothetical protein
LAKGAARSETLTPLGTAPVDPSMGKMLNVP